MKKSILFFLAGTAISFLIGHFTNPETSTSIEIYKATAFGLGWGLAYFVDHPNWALTKKMGISFLGIILLVVIGLIAFNFETAIPSVIKFSTVFVAYYMIASFRENKSLRF